MSRYNGNRFKSDDASSMHLVSLVSRNCTIKQSLVKQEKNVSRQHALELDEVKVNRYTVRGSNCSIFILGSYRIWSKLGKERICSRSESLIWKKSGPQSKQEVTKMLLFYKNGRKTWKCMHSP